MRRQRVFRASPIRGVQVDVASIAPSEFALFESDTDEDLRDALFMAATKLDPVPDPPPAPPAAAQGEPMDVDSDAAAALEAPSIAGGQKGYSRRGGGDSEPPPQMVPSGAKRVRVPARRVNPDLM